MKSMKMFEMMSYSYQNTFILCPLAIILVKILSLLTRVNRFIYGQKSNKKDLASSSNQKGILHYIILRKGKCRKVIAFIPSHAYGKYIESLTVFLCLTRKEQPVAQPPARFIYQLRIYHNTLLLTRKKTFEALKESVNWHTSNTSH